MRLFIKGGTWKNTEDEILKAAVMKYGKNQWSRVASLLNRKSAKQCKARWEEWLDPSIKKTEWTREEEEKLLHLAKIMPTQWRTIAPIVGRTASQCIEHYERLLDQAQERDKDYDPADDPRRLRPGEIDPNPESKPAKPDAVNMDEDEKEMLSEARARLANTKGKKEKRKVRERQLEEARRAAALQKKRELKAAGVVLGPSRYRQKKLKKQTEIDYNNEVPFFRKPPPGFFDTGDEQVQSKQEALAFQKETIAKIKEKNKQREEDEEELKKREQEKIKKRKKENLPEYVASLNQNIYQPSAPQKRSKLVLPKPQISDQELEEIGKLGLEARHAAFTTGSATDKLLTAYKATPSSSSTPLRTPRTPATVDAIKLSAQNLLALQNQQTPLKGGENIALNEQFGDFSGATPASTIPATPNPLLTPGGMRSKQRTGRFMTPGPGATPTPLRDELHINYENEFLDSSARAEKQRQQFLKKQLREKLENLPAPLTNATIQTATSVQDDEDDDVLMRDVTEDDIGEIRRRKEQQKKERYNLRLKRRSQAVQRNLPRPTIVDLKSIGSSSDETPSNLIAKEMISLITHDATSYPIDGIRKKRKMNHNKNSPSTISLEKISDVLLEQAKEMLAIEKAKFNSVPFNAFSSMWDKCVERVFPLDQTVLQQVYSEERAKTEKLKTKLSILTGGYMKKCEDVLNRVEEVAEETDKKSRELETFIALYDLEQNAMRSREVRLTEEVQELRSQERAIQNRYRELLVEKQCLEDKMKLTL